MQAKIKKRLCANQSGESGNSSQNQNPVVTQRVVQPPVQPQPAVVQPRRFDLGRQPVANAETTHSVIYDFVIAMIIVVIGILICRRFSIYSASEPSVDPPTQPPTEEDLL